MGQMTEENPNVRHGELFAALLHELRVEAGRGSMERRRMNRHILRGFRAGLWGAQSQLDAVAVETALRRRMGLEAPYQRNQPVPVGTTEEVMK